MGKLMNETPAVGTTASVTSKTPTSEQLRIAQLLVDPKSEDHSIMKDKVNKVMELTRCNESTALVALHDCDNDVEQAVDKLLDGDHQGVWIVQEGRKSKKVQQHQQSPAQQSFQRQQHAFKDDHPRAIDEEGSDKKFDNFHDDDSKFVSASSHTRGSSGRGGGRIGTDFPPRFRGRGGSGARGTGRFEKENDLFEAAGTVEGDSDPGRWRGRGRGGSRGGERGRGRGFASRGGSRRGGSGGGEGGFDQRMGSWNASEVESNTWDNSMANSCPKPNEKGRRVDERKDPGDSNTWDNSMAGTTGTMKAKKSQHSNDWHSNTVDDWGGEEDWSKLRDGLVIEQSGAGKQNKGLAPVSSSSHNMASSYAAVSASGNHVRGESIDVNMLFSNQLPTDNQTSNASQSAWSTKQATADLKSELGIGAGVPSSQVDSTGHLRQREILTNKHSAIKVELPSLDGRGTIGPIDVQFGDMALGLTDTQSIFGFDAPTSFKPQTNVTVQQHQEPTSLRQGQLGSSSSVFQRSQPDHINGPDLIGSGDASVKIPNVVPATYSISGGYSSSEQGQQPEQHQFGSSGSGIRQITSAPTNKNMNSGLAGLTSGHRAPLQVPVNDSSVQLSKESVLSQSEIPMNIGSSTHGTSTTAAFGLSASQPTARSSAGLSNSRPQVTSSLGANPTMTPYQQAMAAAGLSPYLNVYDQMSLNSVGFLPPQNLFLNAAGGFDVRSLTQLPPVAGNNVPTARDSSGDMKTSFVRQDAGTNFSAAATGLANLSVPPPGLPAPTVSNAEQAAHLLSMAGVYPPLSFINPAAASPYLTPQFLVPNVSSSSSASGGNQFQRATGFPQPPMFNATGYDDLQLSSQDYIKSNFAALASGSQTKGGGGGGMALGINDGNKGYAGGLKGAYDTKSFATATPPPLGNVNFAAPFQSTAGANAAYGYPNYMPPVNMNMLASPLTAAMASNVQLSNDLLGTGGMSQRGVNQNPKTGVSSMGKPTGQYPFQSWGN